MNPELLQNLFDKHAAALELFAAQWTTSPQDCVQEAFFELTRQKVLPDQITAWLFRVVRNRAISERRSQRRRTRHEHAAATGRAALFLPRSNGLIDDKTLATALQSLDESQRELIVARIWGGLTFEQLAEVTGTSRSAAHRNYEAGLCILRERLGLQWLNGNKNPKPASSNAN